jgi:UDPglucose 6-dehydrogenase
VAGYEVQAFDPSQPVLPPELGFIRMFPDAMAAVRGADAAVVCTEWPEFLQLDWKALIPLLRRPLVLDAGRFLEKSPSGLPKVQYITVGSPL